jgi:hypothetical protein
MCDHRWIYKGVLSDEPNDSTSKWMKRCVKCDLTENFQEKCSHAWGYKEVPEKKQYLKQKVVRCCHKCKFTEDSDWTSALNIQ